MEVDPYDGKDGYKYKISFVGREVEAVGAAYREHIYYAALKGNSSSITEFASYLASKYTRELTGAAILIPHGGEVGVADTLGNFYDRTDDAITKIPQESSTPPFMNTDISHRIYLGNIAQGLADKIRENITVSDFQEGLDSVLPEDFTEEGQS